MAEKRKQDPTTLHHDRAVAGPLCRGSHKCLNSGAKLPLD